MRPKTAGLAVIILLVATTLGADQLWPQPVSLYSSENLTFTGKGCASADGGYALFWIAFDGNCVAHVYFQSFNSANQPLTPEPLPVQYTEGSSEVIHTMTLSDGNYLLWYGYSPYYVKLNPAGEVLWIRASRYPPGWDSSWGLVPDLQGGFYASYQSAPDEIRRFDHIDANGNYATPYSMTLLDSNAMLSQLTMLVQPDNSVVCGLRWDNQLRLIKVSPALQRLADSTAYPDSGMVWDAKLVQYTDGSMAWVYLTHDPAGTYENRRVKALKLDTAGLPLWPQPLILLDPDPSWELQAWQSCRLANDEVMVACCFDVSSTSTDYVLRLQKFDPSGNTYFTNAACDIAGLTPVSMLWLSLLPASGQNAFLHLDAMLAGTDTIASSAVYIDSTGFAWPQEVLLDTIVRQRAYNQGYFFLYSANGQLATFYEQFHPGLAALVRKDLQPDGTVSGPISLRDTVFGMIHDPVLAASQNNILSAWIENANFNSYPDNLKQICYQIVDPEGDPVLPIPGTILSGGVFADLKYLRALTLDDGNVLLLWAEASSTRGIRAQLIDPAGNQLWEPGGRTIVSGNQYLNTTSPFTASIYEGAAYVLWSASSGTSAQIRGQKLVGGTPQWGSQGRVLIVANDFPLPISYELRLFALADNYLLYGDGTPYGQNWLSAFRFDSDGETLPGFAPGGISLFAYPDPYDGILYVNHLLSPQGLVVAAAFTDTYYNGHEMYTSYHYTHGQLLSPAGTLEWGAAGAFDYDEQYLCADASGIYLSAGNVLRKLDYQRNLIWQQAFNSVSNRGVAEVAPGSVIGLTDDLRYYTFGATGSPAWPHDYQISSIATENERILALDGSAYVTWGYNSNYYSTYYSYGCFQILLQRVNTSLVAVDDPAAPALEGISVLRAYPNPFSAGLSLWVACSQAAPAKISIYNLRGQLVKTLMDGVFDKGESTVHWDGTDADGKPVAAGIYLCRLSSSGKGLQTLKLVKF